MALKTTSSTVAIGWNVTESGANTFTQETVDLQLSPLDNEVFVVQAIDIDVTSPDCIATQNTATTVALTTTSQTALVNLSNANCLAHKAENIRQDAGGVMAVGFSSHSLESPPADLDYIGIIATNDFFIGIQGSANLAAKASNGKVYGYRAKASADTYAALVQSEVLSA